MSGHHIDSEGRFQSDKYPDLAPDKIVLSFKDRFARPALDRLAWEYACEDPELSRDIRARLDAIALEERNKPAEEPPKTLL